MFQSNANDAIPIIISKHHRRANLLQLRDQLSIPSLRGKRKAEIKSGLLPSKTFFRKIRVRHKEGKQISLKLKINISLNSKA
ncbi:MAG: hypothetical protein CL926_12760 [Deltaproteobacteria bacterium]|nr:hypothetical protein [Deltaproteobacteria bacterium]